MNEKASFFVGFAYTFDHSIQLKVEIRLLHEQFSRRRSNVVLLALCQQLATLKSDDGKRLAALKMRNSENSRSVAAFVLT